MRFLNVEAVLNTDKCTRQAGHETDKTTDYGVNPDVEILKGLGHQFTSYAILSHCWGDEKDEVKFEEMNGLAVMETHKKDDVKGRNGYKKIIKSCEQAMKDGYRWLWIDTCCIDKRSSAELTEAINSMYRWYRDSQMCYVYLNDVDDSALPTKQDFSKPGWVNGWPKWFSRGWTLQELIAPREAIFFNKRWESIGTKGDLTFVLKGITRIPDNVLRYEWVLRSIGTDRPLIAHIMSWAADRETTRVEDRAYSLLGLFDVNMPMLYGEGLKAFQRLQLEIIRVSSDHSIFAWNPKGRLGKNRSVLADDPSCFRECHDTETEDLSWFAEEARQDIRWDWWRSVDPTRLLRFDVTNLGIQLSLPVFPNYSDSSSKSKFTDDSSTIPEDDETEVKYYTAMLPCRDGNRNLITIDLQRDGYKWCSSRSFWPPRIPNRATRPEFRSLYLNCLQHAEESYRSFRFHDKRTSYYGFSRCGAFPQKITDDTVTVSQGKNLFILVYARDKPKSRFAVGLGYYLGEVWARIVCDESSAYQEVWSLGADEFAKQVYNILWKAPIKDHPLLYIRQLTVLKNAHITTNAHLPGTIWNATIVRTTEDKGTDIVVGIEQCPGCCIGPRELHSAFPYELTWISSTIGFHELELEGKRVRFDECFHQKITPGDYGHFSHGKFERDGNILQDLGIDSADGYPMLKDEDMVVTSGINCNNLVLYQPQVLPLPDQNRFHLLLKAKLPDLEGKSLVTTVIQCSGFWKVDNEGRQIDVGGNITSKGDKQSADPHTFTPLCIVIRNLTWDRACDRVEAHAERRQQFKSIREHFYALTNLHHLIGTETCRESANRRMNSAVIDCKSVFGLEYLRHHVGEITFFERLPSTMKTQPVSEDAVVMARRNALSVQSLVKLTGVWNIFPESPNKWTQDDVQSISKTLGIQLLKHICTSLLGTSGDNHSRRSGQVSHVDNDTVNVHSSVREIEALQAKLHSTHDEDEQRALEEDITGKILWFYFRGICSEVEQRFVKDVREIAGIIERTPRIEPSDDMAHFQRVMLDARAGISRHELWLASRAASQIKAGLSGASRSDPTLGTQAAASSTSSDTPCTHIRQTLYQAETLTSSE